MHYLEKKPLVRGLIGVALAAVVLVISMVVINTGVEADVRVITDETYAKQFPDIYASYMANSENNYTLTPDYLENDPYLVTIYEGYGFAKDYKEARGHTYCLEDLANTARPHALANCLTCKTADFTVLVNNMGTDAYSLSYDEVAKNASLNVGCYNCHENSASTGELVVTHDYIANSLTQEAKDSIDPAMQSCGQCHIEYYFAPDTKATSVPWTDVDSMDPAAILEYYNEIDFADWTQESTGTRMLKAQHPEFETVLGKGGMHAVFGLTCASCHMEKVEKDDGTMYISHELVSPLSSEGILSTCVQCHGDTDMTEKVHAIQEKVTARETEIGNQLADLKNALEAAVQSGKYTEDQLNEVRDLYRSAQWFFDFDYVENSEGAHNSTLANKCLDTAVDYIEQAMALLK